MEPQMNREKYYQMSQPVFSISDFYVREDDTNWSSEGAEPWTDAREGRDTEGGY